MGLVEIRGSSAAAFNEGECHQLPRGAGDAEDGPGGGLVDSPTGHADRIVFECLRD